MTYHTFDNRAAAPDTDRADGIGDVCDADGSDPGGDGRRDGGAAGLGFP